MEVHLEEAKAILATTPSSITKLLDGLPEVWIDCREAPGTFSPRDVLGHLIYGEQVDWIPRARIILEQGESRPFDPFDRAGFQQFIAGKSVDELLATFSALRKENLKTLDALKLQPAMLDRTGTHPALGRVTLGQLIATWAVHDLGHIAQIVRVMSRRYRDAVGPWRAYLPILDIPSGNS